MDRRTAPPPSKTAYVVERLRAEIAAGVILQGGALRQTEIAERYGVSPTPVREALRILESAGIISYAPNRGATVREMSSVDGDDLYHLRAEVEAYACKLAVERQDETLVPLLESLATRLEDLNPAHDKAEMYLINRKLHFAISDAGSRIVAQQVAKVWEAFPPVVTVWGFPEIAAQLHDDHRKIIAAIRAGDAALGRKLMREHVLNARKLRREHVS